MNEFLKTRNDIYMASAWLMNNGYTNHPISCKDWELANIVKHLEYGDLLDLGADGSFVLHNAIKKGIVGRKVGIDLAEVTGINKAEGAEYFQGDLMATPFEDNSFDTIVCASVIEHQVDFEKFAKEVHRLLRRGGNLFVSFDFWNPKPEYEKRKLYNLDWNILDEVDVRNLIDEFYKNGLTETSEIDWTTQDAVINDTYCSPVQGVSYTFGLLNFTRQIIHFSYSDNV